MCIKPLTDKSRGDTKSPAGPGGADTMVEGGYFENVFSIIFNHNLHCLTIILSTKVAGSVLSI